MIHQKTIDARAIDARTIRPKAGPSPYRRPSGISALVPSRTTNPTFRIALIIAVMVLLVAGFFVYRYVTSYESTDDAQVDGHINSISARISGHVVKLNVQDNQYVQAGTVLVEIDPADYQVAYDRPRPTTKCPGGGRAAGVNVPITSVNTTSQVSAAEADVDSARAGIPAAKQQFEAAKAQLEQAEANNVKAQNDLGRYKQFVDKQEISQQQYDQAIAAAEADAAGVEAARASADAAQPQVTQAQQRLARHRPTSATPTLHPNRCRSSLRRRRPSPKRNAKKRISTRLL